MKQTIILLQGQSQYDTLTFFLQDLALGFQACGFQTRLVNLNQREASTQLIEMLKQEDVLFFFALNAMGFELFTQGRLLYDVVGIPLIAYFVDHPYHLYHAIPEHFENLLLLLCDQTHIPFAQRYIPKAYPIYFLPHGGQQRVNTLEPVAARRPEIAFFGSYGNPRQSGENFLNLMSEFGEMTQRIGSSIQDVLHSPEPDVAESVFQNLLNAAPGEAGLPDAIVRVILAHMDWMLRMRIRQWVVSECADYPMTVYGNGWESYDGRMGRLTFQNAVPFDQALELTNQYRYILNVLPNFFRGGHERIFYSLLQGASCISDSNSWLNEEFAHHPDLLFYDRTAESIQSVLQTAMAPATLAKADIDPTGQMNVRAHHTWENRARTILQYFYQTYQVEPASE